VLARPSSALAVLLTSCLVTACQSTSSAPEATSADVKAQAGATGQGEAEAADHAQAQAQAQASAGLELRFRPQVGTSWVEEVETDLFSHRSDELPPESPMMRTTRHERFEVLAADEGAHRLRVTLTVLRLEPAESPVFDSRDGQSAPANPLVLDRLALLGLPLVYLLSDTGTTLTLEGVEAYRSAAERRHAALREEAGMPTMTADEETQWRIFLDSELSKPLEWGIRPVLPTTPVQLGDEWTHEVQTSTLFKANARWPIKKRLEAVDPGLVTIHRDADAEFEETPAMKHYIKSAHASLEGQVVLDMKTGALVRTETTVTGIIETAPQPEADLPGGTLKMRSVTKRVRLAVSGPRSAIRAADSERPTPRAGQPDRAPGDP